MPELGPKIATRCPERQKRDQKKKIILYIFMALAAGRWRGGGYLGNEESAATRLRCSRPA